MRIIVLVVLAGVVSAREPVTREQAGLYVRLHALTFEQGQDAMPGFVRRGGFGPSLADDHLFAGLVIGLCRRYPARIPELLDVKVPKDARPTLYGAVAMGGGLPHLRARAKDDELAAKLIAAAPEAPRIADLDWKKKEVRRVLLAYTSIRADPAACLKLVQWLDAARDEERDEAARHLAALAIANGEVYEFVRELRPLAKPALAKDLGWIEQQAKAER
ncbi:MAG: hypothetical protein AAGD14_12600 [Planctomycetota bacterium]